MEDNVKLEMVEMVDADRSGDAVRSGKAVVVGFDLSACEAFRFVGTSSDNVKKLNDNVDWKRMDDNVKMEWRMNCLTPNFKYMEHEPLVQGNYYHIFNRGNNRCNLFEQPAEYEHFLWLYDKYVSPVADTLAWALMRNHFHFLVYIKKDVVYKYSIETLNRISPDKIWYEDHKWETVGLLELFDADRSEDAVRSGKVDVVGFDLSACVAPDNVKMEEDNVKLKLVNADRSKDAVRFRKPVPYRHFSHLFNAYSRYLQTRNGRTGNLFERPFKRKMIDTDEYLKTVVLYIHNNPVHHGFCNHTMEYPWTSYLTSISEKPTKLNRVEIIKLFHDTENFKQQHNHEIDIAPIEKWLEIAPSDLHDYDLNLSQHESDADRSRDAVRSGDADVVGFDLSACAAPDNVKMMEMIDEIEIVDADSSIIDADRARPDWSGSRDAVRSGEAAPENVAEIPADGKRETNETRI